MFYTVLYAHWLNKQFATNFDLCDLSIYNLRITPEESLDLDWVDRESSSRKQDLKSTSFVYLRSGPEPTRLKLSLRQKKNILNIDQSCFF